MSSSSPIQFADYWQREGKPKSPLPPAPEPQVPAAAADTGSWEVFGFIPADAGGHTLPTGVVALQATGVETHAALIDLLKTMGVPSTLAIWTGDRRVAFHRLADPALLPALARSVPEGVTLISEGEQIDLSAYEPGDHAAKSVAELSELTAADIRRLSVPEPDPVVASNPLLPFSVRGQSEKFRQMAVEATPLLGDVCLRGQVTVWYAAPGTGKTLVALSLLLDAVREGRIAGGNAYYVNADDNGKGFATKLQITDDIGANTLGPNLKGFRTSELISLLHKMADQDEARGVLVIVDTIKKFASIMDKRASSEFAQSCRRVAMAGGTVLGLAHIAKNSNPDGTPRYAGTTDLVDDADAAYTLKLLEGGSVGEKVVEFRCFKSRGDSAETAAYAFAAEKGVSYEDLLASVTAIDPAKLDDFRRVEAQRSDAEVIDAVVACIAEGINTKMLLGKEVASRTGISGRAAGRLIERYTGDDPVQHRWRFVRGERGAQLFEALPAPAPATPAA